MVKEQVIEYPIHESDTLTTQTADIKLKISDNNSMYIIHRSLIKQMAEKRQGTAHCKTRSEVRGGGRKPWKQKGTGKARAGSIRSPLWRGGGVIFGPKSKIYSKKVNSKEKKIAIGTLLFNKLIQTITIPEIEFSLSHPRTQLVKKKIHDLGIDPKNRVLIIVQKKEYNLYLASRNLPNVELVQANQINIISLLKSQNIIVTREGLSTIEETYNA
jgi:large subunit ribosomal protein L4